MSQALRYTHFVFTAAASPAIQKSGFRRLWVSLRALFHEVTGAIFAVLALAWLNSALRGWTRDVAHWLIATTVALAVLFLFFSITSFRRARKIK
ncbi:MAG: hypothetical protein PVS2B2_18380 [Candidatus Acidiferrum sp.]